MKKKMWKTVYSCSLREHWKSTSDLLCALNELDFNSYDNKKTLPRAIYVRFALFIQSIASEQNKKVECIYRRLPPSNQWRNEFTNKNGRKRRTQKLHCVYIFQYGTQFLMTLSNFQFEHFLKILSHSQHQLGIRYKNKRKTVSQFSKKHFEVNKENIRKRKNKIRIESSAKVKCKHFVCVFVLSHIFWSPASYKNKISHMISILHTHTHTITFVCS